MTERRKQWLLGFIATWIGGFWAHGYHILNLQPNHDCILFFKGVGAAMSHGRWFLGIASSLSGEYNMPWLIGLLSFTYLGIATIVVWELLELKKTSSIVLIGIMFSVFPTVTAAFSFMFIADGHMLAFLMACVAILLTKKYRFGFLPGVVLMCLSLGTYQAELSVAVILVVLLVVKDLLINGIPFWETFKRNWKQGITILGGLIGYFSVTKIVNHVFGVTLSSYQGINQMRLLSRKDIWMNMQKAWAAFKIFLGIDTFPHCHIYGYINMIILLFILILSIVLIFKNHLYKHPVELICAILGYVSIPFACFIVLLVSMEVQYTITMLMGICFVYVLLIMLSEHIELPKPRYIEWGAICIVMAIAFHFVQDANIAYFYLDVSYERTYSTCANILGRIDQLDNVPDNAKLAIIGMYRSEGESYASDMEPYISGVPDDTFLYFDYHYTAMWDYYFGRDFELASSDEIEEIKQTEIYKEMETYPHSDAVQVIGDYIIVKLTEE